MVNCVVFEHGLCQSIVFGEHAAAHGQATTAAAISPRSYLLVNTLYTSRCTVRLNFSDIGFDHSWEISTLPWDIFNDPRRKKTYYSPATRLDPMFLAAVEPQSLLNASTFHMRPIL
jgi:mevalonate kinase